MPSNRVFFRADELEQDPFRERPDPVVDIMRGENPMRRALGYASALPNWRPDYDEFARAFSPDFANSGDPMLMTSQQRRLTQNATERNQALHERDLADLEDSITGLMGRRESPRSAAPAAETGYRAAALPAPSSEPSGQPPTQSFPPGFFGPVDITDPAFGFTADQIRQFNPGFFGPVDTSDPEFGFTQEQIDSFNAPAAKGFAPNLETSLGGASGYGYISVIDEQGNRREGAYGAPQAADLNPESYHDSLHGAPSGSQAARVLRDGDEGFRIPELMFDRSYTSRVRRDRPRVNVADFEDFEPTFDEPSYRTVLADSRGRSASAARSEKSRQGAAEQLAGRFATRPSPQDRLEAISRQLNPNARSPQDAALEAERARQAKNAVSNPYADALASRDLDAALRGYEPEDVRYVADRTGVGQEDVQALERLRQMRATQPAQALVGAARGVGDRVAAANSTLSEGEEPGRPDVAEQFARFASQTDLPTEQAFAAFDALRKINEAEKARDLELTRLRQQGGQFEQAQRQQGSQFDRKLRADTGLGLLGVQAEVMKARASAASAAARGQKPDDPTKIDTVIDNAVSLQTKLADYVNDYVRRRTGDLGAPEPEQVAAWELEAREQFLKQPDVKKAIDRNEELARKLAPKDPRLAVMGL